MGWRASRCAKVARDRFLEMVSATMAACLRRNCSTSSRGVPALIPGRSRGAVVGLRPAGEVDRDRDPRGPRPAHAMAAIWRRLLRRPRAHFKAPFRGRDWLKLPGAAIAGFDVIVQFPLLRDAILKRIWQLAAGAPYPSRGGGVWFGQGFSIPEDEGRSTVSSRCSKCPSTTRRTIPAPSSSRWCRSCRLARTIFASSPMPALERSSRWRRGAPIRCRKDRAEGEGCR